MKITPEQIADKLAAVRQLQSEELTRQFQQYPRLAELGWMLQWQSGQPGGLDLWLKKFIDSNRARLGTPTMRGLANGAAPLTFEQRRAICEELNDKARPYEWPYAAMLDGLAEHERDAEGFCQFASDYEWPPRQWKRQQEQAQRELERPDESSFACSWNASGKTLRPVKNKVEAEPEMPKDRRTLAKFTKEYFSELFHRAALEIIPKRLEYFLTHAAAALNAPWWMPDLIEALFRALDGHAAARQNDIAPTTIVAKVFDGIDYALQEHCMVHIQGESRFGKTEAIRTKAAMHPGLLRIVNTPSSNGDADLYRAVAEAVGVEFSFTTPGREIKARVEHVIRNNGPALIFDEAHFLLPQRYGRTSIPSRLNWLRTAVADRRCPVILVSTPQSYDANLRRFVNKTGYTIEQFLGRQLLHIPLSNTLLTDADVEAVAAFHCQGFSDDARERIIARALQRNAPLIAVEATVSRARYLSRRHHRQTVSLADVDAAILEVMPGNALAAPVAAPAPALKPARATRPAAPQLPAPRRAVTPSTVETQPA